MIKLEHISKTYKMGDEIFHALKDINLTIDDGDFVAIMGPSGSGKTTLMNILGLLDIPQSGSYELCGKEVAKLPENDLAIIRRRTIGFIFQQFNLIPKVPSWENVSLPLLYTEHNFNFDKSKALLEQVGLGTKLYNKPSELSGGQQQRVAIARSLVNSPKIIFADEPTGNLDSKSEREIMQILHDLNDQGITIVVVTHEDEIGEEANRVIRMRDGEIVSDERKRPLPSNVPSCNIIEEKQGKSWVFEWINFVTQGFKTLMNNKVRTFLSMLGILIGVASVVAMLAIGKGAQLAIEEQLRALGSNLLIVRPGPKRVAGVAGEDAAIRIRPEDVNYIKNNIPVKAISATVSARAQVTYKDKNWGTQVMGANADYEIIRSLQPTVGRFFNSQEDLKRMRVAVVGLTVVDNIFPGENPIGKIIKINKIPFQVIGVLPSKGANAFQDQDDMVIVPLNTAMRRLMGLEFVKHIEVEAVDAESLDKLENGILDLMYKKYKVPLSQREEAFRIRNMADIKETAQAQSNTLTMLLAIIAGISLLVGGVGIMNIMLVSVTERTREIGLRKSVGAKQSDILAQFLSESVVISLTGGISGVLLAWIIATILSLATGWTTVISLSSILLSVFFSVGIGLIFGIYPAKKASQLNPIDALRHE